VSFAPPPRKDNGPLPQSGILILNPTNDVNITGHLVYLQMAAYNSIAYMSVFSDKCNSLQARGAIGIISAPRTDRLPGYNSYGPIGAAFSIPCGVVPQPAIVFARTQGKNVTFNFYGYDPNPWAELQEGVWYIIFCIVCAGGYFFNVCLAGYRLVKWMIVKKGIDYNIGFGCLALEWLCNLLRVIQFPFWGLYNNFLIPGIDVLYTIPWCLTGVTSIIIVFFWLDLTSDPLYHGKFMGIMKIPAGIFIVGLITTEITFDVLRQVGTDYQKDLLIIYAFTHLLVVTVNFIAAYRILMPFNKNVETKKKIRKIVYRIIGSGIATIPGVILFLFFALDPQIQATPIKRGFTWFFLYFLFFLQSLLLILIFKVPKKPTFGSSSGKDTKETKETSKDPSTA